MCQGKFGDQWIYFDSFAAEASRIQRTKISQKFPQNQGSILEH